MNGLRWRAGAAALAATALVVGMSTVSASAGSQAAGPACTAAGLSLSVPASIPGDPSAGMGNLAWNILLRNAGGTCALAGWPAVQVRGAGGTPVAIKARDITESNLGAVPARRVLLEHGQQAVVTVDTTDNMRGCPAGWTLRLTLPGAAGSISSVQPARLFGPCGGASLALSPFYSQATLAGDIRALSRSATPPVAGPATGSKPAACSSALMQVTAAAVPSAPHTAIEVLSLASRGQAACVLPTEWPTVLLHESSGGSQVAKALPGTLARGADPAALTAYGRDDDVTLRPGAPLSVALVSMTTGSACYQARSATVYPATSTLGAGTPAALGTPMAFCGLPRVLPYLSAHPAASALRTEAQELAQAGGFGPDGDGPKGFWYGTDSNAPVPTSEVDGVWQMPYSPVGGAYGGYVGELGAFQNWQGCGSGVNWNQTGYLDAESNYKNHGDGVGAGTYWMMAGAGREPNYSSTNGTEAQDWGEAQAKAANADFQQSISFPYVFMDIENVYENGWDEAWSAPCGGSEVASYVPGAIDRDTFNGFWDYFKDDTAYLPGVYCAGGSSAGTWSGIFGSGETLGNTSEWTYVNETTSISTFPYEWDVNGVTPVWFASIPAKCELLWQWSGGNGQTNGVGDFDQIDGNNDKACD